MMSARDQILDLKKRIGASIIGQDAVIEQLLIALLANGWMVISMKDDRKTVFSPPKE